MEDEREQLETKLKLVDDQRASTRPSWLFLGSGLATMLSGFIALELVGNFGNETMPGARTQIPPSTYCLGVIVAGGFAAIVGAVLAVWVRVRDRDLIGQADVIRDRLDRVNAAIATESPERSAPDGSPFVPRAY
ncbi:MAG: hypothetical protein QM723_03155 [Myxococcaceae bacterium]